MNFNKGDWVRFVSPKYLFAEHLTGNWCLFDHYVPIGDRRIRSDHSDHLREGIVVEALHPHVVQVLYTGDNSPKEVIADHLERIEDNKTNLCP
jgi:hypothetical protein